MFPSRTDTRCKSACDYRKATLFKYSGAGILHYDKNWLVLRVHPSVGNYYLWWCNRLTGRKLSSPLHNTHVTVCAGKYQDVTKHKKWGKYQDKKIDFAYSSVIMTDGKYFWLPVQCKFLERVRLELGLTKCPFHPWHMTIGFLNS